MFDDQLFSLADLAINHQGVEIDPLAQVEGVYGKLPAFTSKLL